MFPTCVGMNRLVLCFLPPETRVPHMRGDEPFISGGLAGVQLVFPTCVGMNRPSPTARPTARCVPHMRGDEPELGGEAKLAPLCSPHALG